ncbi:TPA: hypothetical protein N0F65_012921 [Lagenidium giganteum]|uniref:MULE transposase domain-containing protein n=1 Tax=Lagenidium giganteum TaxID=4803 RepID=A0AAV2YQV5_9STRA|nr:TPA: hypothetical protein N0F65_012921 [Lagenidium giganteum]
MHTCNWKLKVLLCDQAPVETSRHGDICATVFEVGNPSSTLTDVFRPKLTRMMKRSVRNKVQEGLKPARIRNELFNEFALTNPWIGDGSVQRPLLVGFSCGALICHLQHAEAYPLHVDATFKLTKKGFPVIVVGVSDANRAFHYLLHLGFGNTFLRRHFEISTQHIKPLLEELQSSNADDAQHNAAVEVFGLETTHLMCYFHYTFSSEEFAATRDSVLAQWMSKPALRPFAMYFHKQWLSGRYQKWQCYHTAHEPSPLATTNNLTEKFNKELKRNYTGRTLLPINLLAKKLLEMCAHRAELGAPFSTQSTPPTKLQARTKKLMAHNLLVVNQSNRMSIAFLTPDSDGAGATFVRQLGFTLPGETTEAYYQNKLEVRKQPPNRWCVATRNFTCQSHGGASTFSRLNRCLKEDPNAPQRRGREAAIGHALAME